MEKVEELMANRKWRKHCLRVNVAQPEDIAMTGAIKVAKIYSNVLNKREKEPELYDAIKEVAPESRLIRTWSARDIRTTVIKSTLGFCGLAISQEER